MRVVGCACALLTVPLQERPPHTKQAEGGAQEPLSGAVTAVVQAAPRWTARIVTVGSGAART